MDGFSFSTDVRDPLRGDRRAGHRAPCVVRRLARGRARRLPRANARRIPGDPRARPRGAHDRGLPALPPRRVLRRDAHRLGALRRRARRALHVRVPDRARTGARRRRLLRNTPTVDRETYRPIARARLAGRGDRYGRASARRSRSACPRCVVLVRGRVGLRRLRLGDLRPDADDALLALVGRRPRLRADQLAVGGSRSPRRGRTRRRRALLLDDRLALGERRILDALDRHRAGDHERRRGALDRAALSPP